MQVLTVASARMRGINTHVAPVMALLLPVLACLGCTGGGIGPGPFNGEGDAVIHNSRYFAWSPLTAKMPSYGRKVVAFPTPNHYQLWGSIPGVEGREMARGTLDVNRTQLAKIVGEAKVGDYATASGDASSTRSQCLTVEYVVFGAEPVKVVDKLNDDPKALEWLRSVRRPMVIVENVVLLKQESLKKLDSDGNLTVKVLPANENYGGQIVISAEGSDSVKHVLGAPAIWAYKMHRVLWSPDRCRIVNLSPDIPGSPR